MVRVGLILSTLAAPGHGSAQTLYVGGGLSAATWGGSDADDLGVDKSSRKGLRFGAVFSMPVANRIAISPGAFYVQKGVSLSDAGDEATFKQDYFEIPVLASITLTGPDSRVGFGLNVGPALSFETGCKLEGTSGTTTASVDCDTAGAEERQALDVGGMAGVSVSFPVNSMLILVTGAANVGMRSIDTSSPPDDIKNRAFYLSAFLGFPLGG